MAIKAINPHSNAEHISVHDVARTEQDGATIWVIGTLDSNVYAYVSDRLTQFAVQADSDAGAASSVRFNQNAYETVQFGLKGWRNFTDEHGVHVNFATSKKNVGGFSYEVVKDTLMQMIPLPIIHELAKLIKERNALTASAEKNSGSASSPSGSSPNGNVTSVPAPSNGAAMLSNEGTALGSEDQSSL